MSRCRFPFLRHGLCPQCQSRSLCPPWSLDLVAKFFSKRKGRGSKSGWEWTSPCPLCTWSLARGLAWPEVTEDLRLTTVNYERKEPAIRYVSCSGGPRSP